MSGTQPRNPYVGPRAFRPGERLPNRERATYDLVDLLLAERVVLLHAPSGAGKTSLIQASVTDVLRDKGFSPSPAIRVDRALPAGVAAPNRYVFSTALDLLGTDWHTPSELADMTLSDIVAQLPAGNERQVLIFDQFEEVLILDPTDLEEKEEFFRQLGSVLGDGSRWALLAMREDYMGGLAELTRFVPGGLRSHFRLDFLGYDEAIDAVRKPAGSQGVDFEHAAARELVLMLADTTVDRPGEQVVTRRHRVVEPFQLQVVCRQLWKDVRESRGDNFPSIRKSDVEGVDIRGALGRYYRRTMAEFGANERFVRDWFEDELITVHLLRNQTSHLPLPGEAGARVVNRLMDAYLVRSDHRAGTTWYELTHDRLVGAVRDQNDAWRSETLPRWQAAAYEWRRKNRRKEFLLTDRAELHNAPQPFSRDLTADEREFLRQSHDEAGAKATAGQLGRMRAAARLLPVLVVVSVVEFAIILSFLFFR